MTYSIKTRGATLWKTGFTVDQIRRKFSDQGDSDEWLICPLGDAADAIDVKTFLQTPEYFEQLAEQRQKNRISDSTNSPTSAIDQQILKELRGIHRWVRFFGIIVIIYLLILLIRFIQ